MARRLWFRDDLVFVDHPLYISGSSKASRPLDVWANANKDKIKVYCAPCLEQDIGKIVEEEEALVRSGRLTNARTSQAIKLHLFNIPATQAHGWLETRTDTLISHIRSCTGQTIANRNRAAAEHQSKQHGTPKSIRTYGGGSHPGVASPQPVYLTNAPPLLSFEPGPSHHPAVMQHAFISGAPLPVPMMVHDAAGAYRSNSGPPTRYNSPVIESVFGTVSTISRTGSPAESMYTHISKRSRTSLSGKRLTVQRSFSDLNQTWNEDRQKEFEILLARLTASGGFALNWVTNPEFLNFCAEFIPNAKVPSRKSLTQRILPRLLKDIRSVARARASKKLLTVQCDGWSGGNNHHLVAFMATSSEELFTVKVFDTSTERKTAENLLRQIEEVIQILRFEWGAIVIALTSDASGESRKARRLLYGKNPDLVVPDCFAHQINLVVGDYFKVQSSDFLEYAATANDLITWLRSKQALLGLIRGELIKRNKTPLSVIRPVPTRWTAFYLAYRRLLELRRTLENIVEDDAAMPQLDRHIIQPAHERSAREKAARMVIVIKDPLFWMALLRITRHLAPLAIAANVTQAAHCRLDEVLMTFGKLYMEYQKLTDDADQPVQKALIDSIEKRWKKSDQDVLIAAIILNPFHKIAPFRAVPHLVSLGAIYQLFERLWERFYKEKAPPELYQDVRNYLSGQENYAFLNIACSGIKNAAAARNESPDPLRAYNDITVGPDDTHSPPVVKLARHILSICPNSASCERLFSTFGLILTKLRSRLGQSTLLDLAELKMHIRDQHHDIKQTIRQRTFGTRCTQTTEPTTSLPGSTDAGPVAAPSGSMLPPHIHTSAPTNESYTPDDDAEMTASIDLDAMPSESSSSSHTTSNSSTRSLQLLTTNLAQLSTNEDLADAIDDAPSKFPIKDLFDFQASYWLSVEQRSAVGSLADEMELYELLDLDAVGDLDPDLDDAVASLFHM